jgi:hypothetical protein
MAGIEITIMDDHFVRVVFSVNFEGSSHKVHSEHPRVVAE